MKRRAALLSSLVFLVVLWQCDVGLAKTRTVIVSVRVNSESRGFEGDRALDGNAETMWHTEFRSRNPVPPHSITIDLGKSYPIRGFVYVPRPGRGNGTIMDYEFFISDDLKATGAPVMKGTFDRNSKRSKVILPTEKSGRYVTMRALSEVNGRPWTSIAELDLLSKGIRFRTRARSGALSGRSITRVLKEGEAYPADTSTIVGALDLARRTHAFVERSAQRPELARELDLLEKKITAGDESEAMLAAVNALRRRIILSHPTLAFDSLLINKRPPPKFQHQSDQYFGRYSGIGAGLVVLDSWKDKPRERVLLKDKLPPGSVLHPDLSFDGKRILFSYCDHSEKDARLFRFFIYEINVDGTGLRQITGTAADPLVGRKGRQTVLIEDYDPCYLPDGGIAFISTRNQGGVRCHHGGRYCPTFTLYRCNGDGSNIREMVFGEANEWDPSLLHDGRIIWTRWDYINRHDTIYQSLWSIRPDGTGTAHYYGNYSRNPCSIAEARAIPNSHKVVATTTAHHMYTSGSIIVIDPDQGQDGEAPLTRITPEVSFPETEGYPATAFATPWPLSEDLFLVAYSPKYRANVNSYAIYLIDTLGGRELIYRDPDMSCFAPMPLRPRHTPPALPSIIETTPKKKTGTFYVQNVYQSDQDIPAGSVKALRVIRIYEQPAQRVPDRSFVLFETAKSILGTVPVEEDGSVAFEAPAGEPLLFQLLDENGMSVMSMRSFVFLHDGERQSCAGCHEPRESSPTGYLASVPPKIRQLIPPVGPQYEGGISFARTVQPVLDRHCIGCHGLDETAGNINLLGTLDPAPLKLGRVRASTAYNALTRARGLVVVAHRNRETVSSVPRDYFAHAGRLAHMLLEGDDHHDALDRESFQRIVDWLDLNAPFYGDYSWNKAEWRQPDQHGEQALRQHIATVFGEELSRQSYAALVNVALPTESRILKAPLAVDAGGWGQLTKPGWKSTASPGYQKMLRLVNASIAPLEHRDVVGTCNRAKCECGACWIPVAEAEYKKKISAGKQ